jgi:putative two-component system response regulator
MLYPDYNHRGYAPAPGQVLIVDDDPNGREVLRGLLHAAGYSLLLADNGRQALELAAEHMPDLILLDVIMPGLDGFAVCRLLRRDRVLAETPVVLVTALSDMQSRMQGLEAGADDFIAKPIDPPELQARVASIMRLSRYRQLLEERRRATNEARHATDSIARAYDQTLQGWIKALELRDDETEAHSRRVTDLTVELARRAGLPEKDMIHIWRGALLHDIGKLGVPDQILRKPGPLLLSEQQIMQQHPVYAYEWLAPIDFLHPALDIPYAHHERWDGSGYPRGLRGSAIPHAARLFAVVDAWDAMTHDRPYRAVMSPAVAYAELQSQAGVTFDPEVVRLFLPLIATRQKEIGHDHPALECIC